MNKKVKHSRYYLELSLESDYMFFWVFFFLRHSSVFMLKVIQEPVVVLLENIISGLSVFIKEHTQTRAQIASRPDANSELKDIPVRSL